MAGLDEESDGLEFTVQTIAESVLKSQEVARTKNKGRPVARAALCWSRSDAMGRLLGN